ncbi:ubiquinone biosynthesis O-methyltransferase [Dichomitus squalens LYAD-421 SS1]|uniref:ubiquinone biosynthesis O-methyltransferase n=1 Tax=Dichomitus squalens (strain LYAD-421) TaxID=732165 RepID=UPI0004415D0A|nr:ubiquinone biosynthesis O-methyltransferase [Dichomitus squalens LYAD-421 SS1]EJF64127.1 ubiquinone biosynthesis O-methyltransferase [Dichomitus squalens LYAD-421 SS1]
MTPLRGACNAARRSLVYRWATSASRHFASLHAGPANQSSVNPDEIAHFSKLSQAWWDERGEFGLLHKMNPVRIQFIRQKMLEMRREDGLDDVNMARPLNDMDVLDVGCGGGLLCESLARLGGRTFGIDASASNIAIASLHASADPGLTSTRKGNHTLTYEHTSVEDLLAQRGPKSFDVVCSMEVIEHVDNPAAFLTNCATLVKPGGHLFLSTIARTPLSYALTILAAEHIFRLVTPGTHTHSKYINPDELTDFFLRLDSDPASQSAVVDPPEVRRPWISRLYGSVPARTEAEVRGIIYLPWKGEWMLVPRGAAGASAWAEACNYLFWVRRPFE